MAASLRQRFEGGTSRRGLLGAGLLALLMVGHVSAGWADSYCDQVVDEDTNSPSMMCYPTCSSFATWAFEDRWPLTADYDMNDLVLRYRLQYLGAGTPVETHTIKIVLQIVARGGRIHSGFGILIPLPPEGVTATLGLDCEAFSLAADPEQTQATFRLFLDAFELMPMGNASEDCLFANTSAGCAAQNGQQLTLTVSLPVGHQVPVSSLLQGINPFLFDRDDWGREIHLPGFAPTDTADSHRFGTGQDATTTQQGKPTGHYYMTSSHLPWALDIPVPWDWPIETVDMLSAYPDFLEWAQNNGLRQQDWFAPVNASGNHRWLAAVDMDGLCPCAQPCVSQPGWCDDGHVCTDDVCDEIVGCVHSNNTVTETCYDGSPVTVDVGECKEGLRTCQGGDGGACEGQVLPSAEVNNGKDDDCDGSTDEDFVPWTLVLEPQTTPSFGRDTGIQTVDMDQDGFQDLMMGHDLSSMITVYRGMGNGTFGPAQNYTTARDTQFLTVADFNRDGRPDVAVSTYYGPITLLFGQPNGTLAGRVDHASGLTYPLAVSGDFNNDAAPDLAFTGATGTSVFIMMNQGNGTFGEISSVSAGTVPRMIVVSDIDRDGNNDMLAGNLGSKDVSLLWGRGDGTFQTEQRIVFGSPRGINGLALSDLDGNGTLDLVVTNGGVLQGVGVLPGNGAGGFGPVDWYHLGASADASSGWPKVTDMNGDGRPDILVSMFSESPYPSSRMVVLLNQGSGVFGSLSAHSTSGTGAASLNVGDFDRNGKMDVVVTNFRSNVLGLLFNRP